MGLDRDKIFTRVSCLLLKNVMSYTESLMFNYWKLPPPPLQNNTRPKSHLGTT